MRLLLKKLNVKRFISLIIVGLLLVGIQIVFASETFQNNLLKIHLFKNPLGEIKILLLTNKQYKDAVIANKKSDFEYVILMPETANSLTDKPKLDLVSDIIKNVEIKTVQYQNGLKGYTKITIYTLSPVTILPQAQVFSSAAYKFGENDYTELLAQTTKKQPAKTKTVSKPMKKEVIALVKPKVTAQAKGFKPASRKIEQTKQIKKATVKPMTRITKISNANVSKTRLTKKANTQVSQVAIKESVKIIKPTKPMPKHVIAKSTPKVQKTVVKTLPTEKPILVPPVKTVSRPAIKPANRSYAPESAPAVIGKDVINPPYEPVKTEPSVTVPVNNVASIKEPAPKISIPVEQKVEEASPLNNNSYAKYKDFVKNNLYLIGGGLTAFFLILLLIAKSMNKSAKTRKETFVSHLKEKPANVTNLAEQITDDMTWKEKFQTYTEANKVDAESSGTTYVTPAEKDELDELFVQEEISPAFVESEDTSFSQDTTAETVSAEFVPESFSEENNPEELYSFDEYKTAIYGESQKPMPPEPDALEQVEHIDEINEEDISIEELFAEEQISQELSVKPTEASISKHEIISETEEEVAEPDNLIKSEFSIDNNKGFYLVDFEDSTALVGHIGEDIFVLKRFNERINARLQARLNEKSTNSASFMTKVGDFKGVVEVTPDNMRLLIEL